MFIKKIRVQNYKLLRDTTIQVNPGLNIFVGENDSGKSTILEAISVLVSGKLNGYSLDRQIRANLFNSQVRAEYRESLSQYPKVLATPSIVFEAYCEPEDATDARYGATNNSLNEDCPGIRVAVEFRPEYEAAYKKLLGAREIHDIPVEFYGVSYRYFSGELVTYRFCPIRAAFIDTTRKDYASVVDRFVSENITAYLSTQEQVDLSTAYRKSRDSFQMNPAVAKLNEAVKANVHIGGRVLAIDLKEEDIDEWKSEMAVVVDDTPFENVGFGSQNTIKIELALKNSATQVNLVLMEEPENNLSFTNMAKLVQRIVDTVGKQVFISTHSSYIANKLNLGNLFLVHKGSVTSFASLPGGTKRYFQKLPGYDTLRLVLAEEVILVEGPTEELIVERAFLDEHGRMPISDGIDVIVVNSLAFKRYCDIALLLNKRIVIITDNDGDVENNIRGKYAKYLGKANLMFAYEDNEALRTIEHSVLEINLRNGSPSAIFRRAISRDDSMMNKTKDEVLDFMLRNKTEWAMRVFDSKEKIRYPRYILDAVKQHR